MKTLAALPGSARGSPCAVNQIYADPAPVHTGASPPGCRACGALPGAGIQHWRIADQATRRSIATDGQAEDGARQRPPGFRRPGQQPGRWQGSHARHAVGADQEQPGCCTRVRRWFMGFLRPAKCILLCSAAPGMASRLCRGPLPEAGYKRPRSPPRPGNRSGAVNRR